MSNTAAIINPKPCNYGCGTRIYWDTSSNTYLEVFTKQRHICKNRNNNNNASYSKTNLQKTNYYNRFSKQPKPRMSNSLELLTGPIDSIQKKYEILSDIVTEYQGKVHGSPSSINGGNNISLIVYYEVLDGKREEVKTRFKNSNIALPSRTRQTE